PMAEHVIVLAQLSADVLVELGTVPDGGLGLDPVDRPSVDLERFVEEAVGGLGVLTPAGLLGAVAGTLAVSPPVLPLLSRSPTLVLNLVAPWRVDGVRLGELYDLLLRSGVGYALRFADVLPELLLGEAVLLEQEERGQDGGESPLLGDLQQAGTGLPFPEH